MYQLEIPGLLSWLGAGSVDAEVKGINELQLEYVSRYGAGDYRPIIPVTYWSFRLMILFGMLAAIVALWSLWAIRRGRNPANRWLLRAGLVLPLLPLAGNAAGWIFTEMGRQPWIVFGQMLTSDAASPTVSAGDVWTSLAVFTIVYGILAMVEVGLLLRFARAGVPDITPADEDAERPLAFAY